MSNFNSKGLPSAAALKDRRITFCAYTDSDLLVHLRHDDDSGDYVLEFFDYSGAAPYGTWIAAVPFAKLGDAHRNWREVRAQAVAS